MNLPWKPDDAEEYFAEIKKHALPRESEDSEDQTGRWITFTRSVGSFYHRYIRGWTWEQLDRLREAKLREIESANEERRASAIAKLAEARKLDAEAESAFYDAEAKKLANTEKLLEMRERHQKEPAGQPTQEQWDELRRAIEAIEMKGGKVILPAQVESLEETVEPRYLGKPAD